MASKPKPLSPRQRRKQLEKVQMRALPCTGDGTRIYSATQRGKQVAQSSANGPGLQHTIRELEALLESLRNINGDDPDRDGKIDAIARALDQLAGKLRT